MKTTLDINDTLLANAKSLAAKQRTSLTRLIEEGLQLRLRSAKTADKAVGRKDPRLQGARRAGCRRESQQQQVSAGRRRR